MKEGGTRRFFVETVVFKQTIEGLLTNTTELPKDCLNVVHVEGDSVIDAKFANEAGAYNRNLDDECYEGGRITKLKAIAFKEDRGELLVHLTANMCNVQATVVAEVFRELPFLVIRVEAVGWSMDFVKYNVANECMESGLDSPNGAFAAAFVSLTDVAITPDCGKMIDFVT